MNGTWLGVLEHFRQVKVVLETIQIPINSIQIVDLPDDEPDVHREVWRVGEGKADLIECVRRHPGLIAVTIGPEYQTDMLRLRIVGSGQRIFARGETLSGGRTLHRLGDSPGNESQG